MGIMTRLVDVLNANINAALDKAEQPEKMLKLHIQEMEAILIECRAQAAQFIAERKSLQRRKEQLTNSIEQWQQNAEQAMVKDREDLAKLALIEKHKLEDELGQLELSLTAIAENVQSLSDDMTTLQTRMVQAKQMLSGYENRSQQLQGQKKLRETLVHHDSVDLSAKFEQLNAKLDRIEGELESYELVGSHDVNAMFQELTRDSRLNDELDALKAKVAAA
jgi:phage shock protein A